MAEVATGTAGHPDVPWRRGARLGIDVGRVRVGVARCDPDGILATPVTTLARHLTAEPGVVPTDIADIASLVREHEAVEVVVGLPVTLAGTDGLSATEIRRYASTLSDSIAPVPVRLTDERMSTVVASRRLSERGVRGRRQRAVVDQMAAVVILQGWLDARRRTR
jgi:putative Holliday junction resolvase